MISALKGTKFGAPRHIRELAKNAKDVTSLGTIVGEGWFLTAEMLELIEEGAPNIICMQPFACLPNHVTGKGVMKELKRRYPEANIVAVDYDPGASEVNQVNRIKLMMSVAMDHIKNGGPGNAFKIEADRSDSEFMCNSCRPSGDPMTEIIPEAAATDDGDTEPDEQNQ